MANRTHGKFHVKGTCITGPSAVWRQQFLIRARDVRPKILESLFAEVLPLYASDPVWPVIIGKSKPRADKSLMGKPIPQSRLSVHRKLVKALVAWAKAFHLVERCILYEALSTLSSWERESVSGAAPLLWSSETLGELQRQGSWVAIPVGAPEIEERLIYPTPFSFRADGWSVQLETDKDWDKRVRKDFDEALETYVDELKSTASKQLGLDRPYDLSRFIDWFIRYQLDDDMTYRKLAERQKRSPRTIRDGIEVASEMIGLKKRPPRRGRPKGARDSEHCRRQRDYW